MDHHAVLQIFLLCCGLIFFMLIVRLLLRKKISERNSVTWLLGAAAILIVSANPGWLDRAAKLFGVSYPPSLLFLFSTLVLLVVVLHQSIQISVLNEKLRQLAQHVALLDNRYTESSGTDPGLEKTDEFQPKLP